MKKNTQQSTNRQRSTSKKASQINYREKLPFLGSHSWLKGKFPSLYYDENGAATLEIVIIIAVLIAIALIFNTQLRNFATSLFNKVFDDNSVLDQIGTIGS